ncbi:MAG: FecR domain-containing protein [Caldilineales bacterium]|nr:FecR domain-containing protein [Caldilineales bacterium]MDW8318501.1 SH3 domain-containing protein [Anaerolineae bacterium]
MTRRTTLASRLAVLILLALWAVGCRSPQPSPTTVEANASLDQVTVLRADGGSLPLPVPQRADLAVGEGVDVDEGGRALLRFADLLTVEVVRDGQLLFRALTADEQAALVTVLQGAGAVVYDFNPQSEAQRRLTVQTDRMTVVATGTQFLVVREALTPLDWVISLDAAPNDLAVTANGVTKGMPSGMARWVAPIGEPSPGVTYDAAQVAEWIRKARSGQLQPEVGEVLWPQADVVADTTPLDALPATGAAFTLEGVRLELDPAGLSGSPEYWLEDCNGDGIPDIAMRDGRLHMDFRPVLGRVRGLDVTVYNRGDPGAAAVTVFNPAREPMGAQQVRTSAAVEVVSLRSEPGRPYHYAQLDLREGCFLGFSLTPPKPSGQPGDPRPAVEVRTPPEPTATPTWSPSPTATATPTLTPSPTATTTPTLTPSPTATATPSPTPVCRVVADALPIRSGPDVAFEIVGRARAGALLEPVGRNRQGDWLYVLPVQGQIKGWVPATPRAVACTVDLAGLPILPEPATPTPTATPTAARPQILRFEPQKVEIDLGKCALLQWQAVNAQAVFVEWRAEGASAAAAPREQVDDAGRRQVCPKTTTEYRLIAVGYDRSVAEATATVVVRPPGAPRQVSPADGSVLDNYPRTTTLVWEPVPEAYFYRVEIDVMHVCAVGRWCADVGKTWRIESVYGTEYTFIFVGAQPGRWRVWAVSQDGREGPKSNWWTFTYTR